MVFWADPIHGAPLSKLHCSGRHFLYSNRKVTFSKSSWGSGSWSPISRTLGHLKMYYSP